MRASYLSFHSQMRFDQLFAAEVVAVEVFFSSCRPPFDHGLRGDAGVIGAGHPEGVVALHPLAADEDVLQRVVQGVAQVRARR